MPAPTPRAGPHRDPWWNFVRRSAEDPASAFYFERGASPGRSGRYSFFGFGPSEREEWSEPRDVSASRLRVRGNDPHRADGSWVGFVGFDAVGLFEPLLGPSTPRGSPFPVALFDRYPHVEHAHHLGAPERGAAPGLPPSPEVGEVEDSTTRDRFERSVEHLREAIYDGEAFQVVLAHRRSRRFRGSLLPVVDRLRREEHFAFLYYLRIVDGTSAGGTPIEIAGASPESVVEIRDGTVAVNPIAGTRPLPAPTRGPAARLPLDKDPKELAEHRMLVDLARNDIGRVSQVGSVHLSRRETRVPYARLEHLVSRVVGRLSNGASAIDALVATFPAGTVSGAPKIRATELLRREERSWRGTYGGTVGIVTPGGEADFALAIRSAAAARGRVYTQAGAGIVHLSKPAQEWEETLAKLATVERALEGKIRRVRR
ncbi:MAG: anthranilate synthase component I family protein [Euryarchaeota archaeon]|nr:anthranilate synthase component I family protein [Euryarchaeota archaeon]MDE1837106.1 anthranilate synthase component I family protein [Euryarchaeota archaeon]MDE2045208.1 anthranilate synthase component I family protein [Thermoplasmata archaeon]